MRDRPNGSPHVRRKNKSLVNLRTPFAVPIAAFAHSESVVMMVIPIARTVAIVVVEPIVLMAIAVVIAIVVVAIVVPVVMVPVVISLIVIMMIAIILILCVGQRNP